MSAGSAQSAPGRILAALSNFNVLASFAADIFANEATRITAPETAHLDLLSLLNCSFRILYDSLNHARLRLQLFLHALLALNTILINKHSSNLRSTNTEKQEIDSGQGHVLRSDDEAPPRPNGTRGKEGEVLCKREIRSGTEEVRHAGKDDSPLLLLCQ